ncbi:BamA/TamA family outer membrane protein [Calothrix sp. PCC 6303]|uniref:BamA/TamA family outer membrane protein n=1 Tax=Calothrix sp. PCC 6303 TaxID=1170562 RepID=UPI0002A013B8|nr:BamA/TamA family outer membrane protein [Calothrix sp. PCC 6303]AFZ03716.1 surface antigen (D15) [Calothrix sp. PCC 6303]
MRISSPIILTLASLAASNQFSQQAVASPAQPATPGKTVTNVVIPTTKISTSRTEANNLSRASFPNPETVANVPQFSAAEKPVNSSVVVIKTSQTPTKIPIPVPNISETLKNISVPKTSQTSKNIPIPVPKVAETPKNTPVAKAENSDLVVVAANVQIQGATPELQQIIRQVIKTQAGGETNQAQVQKDVKAILDTELFATASVNTSITPNGLNVVYQVQPIIVKSLELSGAKALTYQVALEPFKNQLGKAINPALLQESVGKINQWYKDNNYSLARVITIKPNRQGILNINVAEGLVGEIKFQFLNENGEAIDSKGKPVTGRTKTDFIQRQFKLKPGDIFKEDTVRQDVQKLYNLGLFESVNVELAGDATKTDVIYQLKETGARSVNVGGSYNADQGIIGTLNYQDRNIGGTNDTLSSNLQIAARDLQFDTTFNSPYRFTEPSRDGYTVNLFRKRGLSDTFDGDIKLADGDRIREGKIGGSVSFQRPINGWDASLGFNYTRVSIRDRSGKLAPTDEQGNDLTLSKTGIDDLATVSFSATQDHRDNFLNPTQGSILKLSTEQSVPLGNSGISMNRVQANFSQFVPVQLYNSKQPQVLAVNFQAGTVIGTLPPYETFNMGGPNSVRGYGTGDVGSGRSYVLASAEYRFPVVESLGGVLFADFASDLGSGDTVLGNPAGVRNKPGIGFGYGAGVRFNSPLGLLRADYGISDQGEGRLHFGLGQNF